MQTYKLPNSLLHISSGTKNFNLDLAERFIFIARQQATIHGVCTIALSGGNTPKSFYSLLTQPAYKNRIPWDRTHLFLSDERCVNTSSPESNFKMIQDTLLSHIDIPSLNVHSLHHQDSDPNLSADEYQKTIMSVFKNNPPRFDLILLGLGTDGHTASLFPDTAALNVNDKYVTANHIEKLQSYRITFTLPIINAAKHVVFMVDGEGKKEILQKVLQGKNKSFPAQMVHPEHGSLEWFIDQDASENLNLDLYKSSLKV